MGEDDAGKEIERNDGSRTLNTEKPPAGLHELAVRHKSIIFGTVLGAIFMSALDVTIVATALPDIVTDLGGFSEYAFVATCALP